MASIHALSRQERIVSARRNTVTGTDSTEKYYIEDGWVFREHHGKYVECICRTEEISTAPAHALTVQMR